MIPFVMTMLSWLAENMPTAIGLVLGAAGVVVGIVCLVVAFQIAECQQQEAQKAEERFKAFVGLKTEQVYELVKTSTGQIMALIPPGLRTRELEEKVQQIGAATAGTIINQVIQMPMLRSGVILHDMTDATLVRANRGPEPGEGEKD